MQIAPKTQLPQEVASQTVAILGIRGSGKTNTAGVIVEELLDQHRQVVVVDPTDAHWGYRLNAGGKPSKYDIFIFGGEHGDVPLREEDGKAIAEFLVEERVPVVLSLRHLRKAGQRRFVTDLAEELYHLKGKSQYRTPMTLVIDEAPLFVPQAVVGEVARTVGAIEDLVARGRNAGFGVVLISQRAATLNKNVLTQAETIICHRLTAPQDKKALKEWFEENADLETMNKVLASLPSQPNGKAWIWSPRIDLFQDVQVRLRRTFDSSATPKPGDAQVVPVRLKEVDLGKLKSRMKELVEEKKKNDPTELKKQVYLLQEKLAELAATTPPEPAVKTVVQKAKPILTDAQVERILAKLDEQITRVESTLAKPLQDLRSAMTLHQANMVEAALETSIRVVPQQRVLPPPKAATRPSDQITNSDVPKGEAATLAAILQFVNPTREELTVVTGYKRSTRDTYIQRLRERGYVDVVGDRIEATPDGRAAMPDFKPLPTGVALQDYWLKRLPEGEARVLHLLLQRPRGVTPDEISEATGYARSTRDTYIQRASSKRIMYREAGLVKPSKMLFA